VFFFLLCGFRRVDAGFFFFVKRALFFAHARSPKKVETEFYKSRDSLGCGYVSIVDEPSAAANDAREGATNLGGNETKRWASAGLIPPGSARATGREGLSPIVSIDRVVRLVWSSVTRAWTSGSGPSVDRRRIGGAIS